MLMVTAVTILCVAAAKKKKSYKQFAGLGMPAKRLRQLNQY